ncbi:MAG: DUF2071 domain-containing protein [Cytophagaceae bacterium]|nr:DUF2071 domain-containing protein [Cytophagaceae bacterium]
MEALKRIPVKYIGELHDVRLVNFSVDIKELDGKVPSSIQVRDFNGRALISMVDVKLKKMHPSFLPSAFHFGYRHVAFRLLIDDSKYNNGDYKGIFFFKSFSDNPVIVTGGNIFTDYNLEKASITEKEKEVFIRQGNDHIRYCIENHPTEKVNEGLRKTVGSIDRAYSVLSDEVRVTQIQREKWPIQQVGCYNFENTFFQTAKLEGAFRVFETIYYQWLPPKSVNI